MAAWPASITATGQNVREKPLKVLFVSHEASLTGAPMELLHIIRRLKKRNAVEPYLLLLSDGPLHKDFAEYCPVLLYSPDHPPAETVFDFCGRPDLIYGNTVLAARLYDLLSLFETPILTHVHELEQVIRQCADRETLRLMKQHSSQFIAASREVADNLEKFHDIAPQMISIVHDFIEVSETIPANRQLLRRELNLPSAGQLILGCGVGTWRKGCDLFVEVARQVLESPGREEVNFCWVGDLTRDCGRCVDPAQMAKRYQLSDRIFFVGSHRDIGDYFRAADLFLLPSREDPFPLVALTACEHRLPVICFAGAGGMAEFVGHGAGFAVPYTDTRAMAAKTLLLLNNPGLRGKIGERARELLLENHTADIAVPRLLAEMKRAALVKRQEP